ncbi:MAG TPA: metallophosphoesterase family protein [Vicinamibacteria bacterium]|nr:metallophosphoesterase family protein [Vicinamibacteria bacterium]
MRVLVVSDIHGNWPALHAVAAVPHDAVLCLGDVVGYGPQPAECLRWLRASGAVMVQGNHDRSVAEGVPPRCRPDFEWLADATRDVARRQLTEEETSFLRTLPPRREVSVDGRRLVLLHAAPADPLYGYLGPDADAWREAVASMPADLVLVGHTHLQFHLRLGSVDVVNPGSLGQPKDGDPRAAYAILEDGVPRLERSSYAVERTAEALAAAGVAPAALTALTALLRTGRLDALPRGR